MPSKMETIQKSLLFHLRRWMYMGASEMWGLCGRGLTKRAIPFHRIVDVLDILCN